MSMIIAGLIIIIIIIANRWIRSLIRKTTEYNLFALCSICVLYVVLWIVHEFVYYIWYLIYLHLCLSYFPDLAHLLATLKEAYAMSLFVLFLLLLFLLLPNRFAFFFCSARYPKSVKCNWKHSNELSLHISCTHCAGQGGVDLLSPIAFACRLPRLLSLRYRTKLKTIYICV